MFFPRAVRAAPVAMVEGTGSRLQGWREHTMKDRDNTGISTGCLSAHKTQTGWRWKKALGFPSGQACIRERLSWSGHLLLLHEECAPRKPSAHGT
ncbi:hypothetical protein CEXT_678931 [Caerostris extrusa]|uniref:Uncharacterized protein n=1 Tax=Caerostris extrusa TaxID=172846 RepID=A0AAV4NC66_CAEEX|nr:hypothetical protein CEXT_678931 [Caerostris extrusa]